MCGLLALQGAAAQEAATAQMEWVEGSWSQEGGVHGDVGRSFDRNRPNDPSVPGGQAKAALIRVKVENVSRSEAERLQFQVVGGNAQRILQTSDQWDRFNELSLYVSTGKAFDLRASHPTYGITTALRVPALEADGTYNVTLRNNRTFAIRIESKPEGALLTFDGQRQTQPTPATLEGITPGSHTVILRYGDQELTDNIEVREEKTVFTYDVQTRRTIRLTCDQEGADIYVDNRLISLKTSKDPALAPELKLTDGMHYIKVVGSGGLQKERTLIVADTTRITQYFPLVAVKSVEVMPVYGNQHVAADVWVDGQKLPKNDDNAYAVDLAIGRPHTLRASYAGGSKTKTIVMRRNSPSSYTLKIPASNAASWRNQNNYREPLGGIDFKYVTKQWVMKGGGYRMHENAPWHRDDSRLHGVSIGGHYSPTFKWGGGLYTGLFWEYYFSKRKDSDEWYADEWGCLDKFNEHVLHAPVHLLFRMPFASDKAFSIHGGLGLDFGIAGSYYSRDFSNFYTTGEYYGHENLMPSRFNLSAEIAASYRWSDFVLSAEYSKGITKHDYSRVLGDVTAHQNKLSVGFGILGDISGALSERFNDCDDEEDNSSVEFCYVSKQWATPNYPSPNRDNVYEFIGESSNTKRLHGFSVGYNLHPCSEVGLGLWTGLYWELYFATADDDSFSYPDYIETGIYMPLHLLYRFPVSENFSLSVHGGLGFDWMFFGEFYDSSSDGSDSDYFYGEDWGPKHCNFSGEIGGSIRIGKLTLGVQYSRGFTKHDMGYRDNETGEVVKTVQNKLSFSAGYSFNIFD